MITVLIADDHAAVRAGVRMILEASGLSVLGEAADGATAVSMARNLRPDVVLMDLRMPGMDGIEATASIVGEGTSAVLVLTTYDVAPEVQRALAAGAAGYALKSAEAEELVKAVRDVAAGHGSLDPRVVPSLLATLRGASDAPGGSPPADAESPSSPWPPAGLTGREVDVMERIAAGLSNRAIGRELHLAETTVKTHVSNALAKLGLESRVQAALFWQQNAP